MTNHDPVKYPAHYQLPGGVQVIDLTRHLSFCGGNVVKYVARAEIGSANPVQDLHKARQYLDWLIENAEPPDSRP